MNITDYACVMRRGYYVSQDVPIVNVYYLHQGGNVHVPIDFRFLRHHLLSTDAIML